MGKAASLSYRQLNRGDPGSWFTARGLSNPAYKIDTAAGRYLLLCFFGSAAHPAVQEALQAVRENADLFDDVAVSFFGVSHDARDFADGRVRDRVPGLRFLHDEDGGAGRAYGALPAEGGAGSLPIRPLWVLLDPMLRVMQVWPLAPERDAALAVLAFVRALPPVAGFSGMPLQAPVLMLPHVFEPALCEALIQAYDHGAPEDSGFMKEIDGKTVLVTDYGHKRRRDVTLADEALRAAARRRVQTRITPEIRKAFQFEATRMERYIVACYAAEDAAHFRPHRDNTTKGTAHRRFAVSINLNDAFDGGGLNFPEYGPASFKPPPGGAVVFSCSLLHMVTPVTAGRRFAFLPFLYDEEAARLREANNAFLGEGLGVYSAQGAS